jgi:hypothetical protein
MVKDVKRQRKTVAPLDPAQLDIIVSLVPTVPKVKVFRMGTTSKNAAPGTTVLQVATKRKLAPPSTQHTVSKDLRSRKTSLMDIWEPRGVRPDSRLAALQSNVVLAATATKKP